MYWIGWEREREEREERREVLALALVLFQQEDDTDPYHHGHATCLKVNDKV